MADVHISTFNVTVTKLITRLEKKTRIESELADLDRLKQRITLAKSVDGREVLVAGAFDVMYEYRQRILETNQTIRDNFFISLDVRAEYVRLGHTINQQDEFIFSLIDSVRTYYTKCSIAERASIYEEVLVLFRATMAYRRATMGDKMGK